MQPFVVQCITCQARIRVSNPELLATIVHCPSCQGMVEIPAAAPIEREAEPGERWQDPDQTNGASPIEQGVDETVEDFGYRHDSRAGEDLQDAARVQWTESDSLEQADKDSLDRPADWLSDNTRRHSRTLLMGLLGLAAVLLITILAYSKGILGPTESVATPTAKPIPQPAESVEDVPPAELETEENPETPAEPLPEETPITPPESNDPESNPMPAEPDPPEPMPEDENPPGLVAEGPEEAATTEDLAAALRAFGAELTNRPLAAGAENTLPADESPAEPLLRDPIPAVDVEAGWNLPLAQFEMARPISFRQFVDLVSELSHVPITIDTAALEASGMTLQTPIQLQLAETTAGALLQQALADHPLAILRLDGHVIISWPPATPTPLVTENHRVKGRDARQLTLLAGWIRNLVTPESWQEMGGRCVCEVTEEGLSVTHTAAGQLEIRGLLAQLNGQVSAAEKNNPTPPTRTQAAQQMLSRPVSVNFGRPTGLKRILDHVAEEAGIAIVVDWTRAHPLGWAAESPATLVTDKDALGAVLATFLGESGLGFRVVDGQTVEVTSAQRALEDTYLDLHDARERLQETPAADLMASLTALLAPDQPSLYVDTVSGHLIVRAQRSDHIRIRKHILD